MSETTRGGLLRLCSSLVVLATIYYLAFVINGNVLQNFLVWVEFKSANPGLSGALIVFSGLALFTAACYIVNWIDLGFKRKPD